MNGAQIGSYSSERDAVEGDEPVMGRSKMALFKRIEKLEFALAEERTWRSRVESALSNLLQAVGNIQSDLVCLFCLTWLKGTQITILMFLLIRILWGTSIAYLLKLSSGDSKPHFLKNLKVIASNLR